MGSLLERVVLADNDRSLVNKGFPGGSAVKNLPDNVGDMVSIPGSGRSPGEGNGNPLQYSCLENPVDSRAWQVAAHAVARVGHDLVTKPIHKFAHSIVWAL